MALIFICLCFFILLCPLRRFNFCGRPPFSVHWSVWRKIYFVFVCLFPLRLCVRVYLPTCGDPLEAVAWPPHPTSNPNPLPQRPEGLNSEGGPAAGAAAPPTDGGSVRTGCGAIYGIGGWTEGNGGRTRGPAPPSLGAATSPPPPCCLAEQLDRIIGTVVG